MYPSVDRFFTVLNPYDDGTVILRASSIGALAMELWAYLASTYDDPDLGGIEHSTLIEMATAAWSSRIATHTNSQISLMPGELPEVLVSTRMFACER